MIRLRQIRLAAREFEATVAALRRVLGLEEGHSVPGAAMREAASCVMPLGHDFLEVFSPRKDRHPTESVADRPARDAEHAVILQCEDGLAVRKRLREMGVRRVHEEDRPPNIWITRYHPADCGGVHLEIDSVDPAFDHLAPECAWPPAGPRWQEGVESAARLRFTGLEVAALDPKACASLWCDLLDEPVLERDGAPEIRLHNATVRFEVQRDEGRHGLTGFDIEVADRPALLARAEEEGCRSGDDLLLCGLRIRLVQEE